MAMGGRRALTEHDVKLLVSSFAAFENQAFLRFVLVRCLVMWYVGVWCEELVLLSGRGYPSTRVARWPVRYELSSTTLKLYEY